MTKLIKTKMFNMLNQVKFKFYLLSKINETYIACSKLDKLKFIINDSNNNLNSFIIGSINKEGLFIPFKVTNQSYSQFIIYKQPNEYILNKLDEQCKVDFEILELPSIYTKDDAVKTISKIKTSMKQIGVKPILKCVPYNEWVDKTHIVTFTL